MVRFFNSHNFTIYLIQMYNLKFLQEGKRVYMLLLDFISHTSSKSISGYQNIVV